MALRPVEWTEYNQMRRDLIITGVGTFFLSLIGCVPIPVTPVATSAPKTPTLPTFPGITSTPKIEPTVQATPSSTDQNNSTQDEKEKKELPSKSETQPKKDPLFDTLTQPFYQEAMRRRKERTQKDSEWSKRVDAELNQDRVNFLLFGYGDSHEPPFTDRVLIGSQTIVSINNRTGQTDIVSLTYDIRATEIEKELGIFGHPQSATKIDQAYWVGKIKGGSAKGFELMGRTLEDATGLSVDFQITLNDAVIQRLIDNVFGGIVVDVPSTFDVQGFWLDGKRYDAATFTQGRGVMDGKSVVQFIKTVPKTEGAYPKSLEHNARKLLILQSLLQSIKEKKNFDFWGKVLAFMLVEQLGGNFEHDFDPQLIVSNLNAIIQNSDMYAEMVNKGIQLPEVKAGIYVVDPESGDGGVQWVNANQAVNDITKRDAANNIYPSREANGVKEIDMEVPINANPYGDLVTEYWPSVRELVKKAFLNK